MNCEEVQNKLSEYFENLADPEIRAGISSHLSSCDHCRAEAQEFTRTVQLVKALPEVEPPVGFAARIMAHVREPATKPRIWQRFFFPFHIKLPIQAAAVILVSILAVFVYHKEPQQRQLPYGEADSDRLGQDKRQGSTAPEFRANGPTTKKDEALAEIPAPKVPASASPSFAKGRTAEDRSGETRSYRSDVSPAAPTRPSQGKPSLSGEISGGHDLPGSATELRDELVTTPVPNEGSRDGMSRVGAAATGAEAKKETTTSATERESISKNALDRLAAPQLGLAPSSLQTREGPADYELLIRLRSATSETETSAGALASRQPANARTALLSPAQKSDLDHAGQRATETQEAQTLWLSISRGQWAQLKAELASFAQIESESAAGLQPEDKVSKAEILLRIKVTILPSLSAPAAPRSR